MLEQCHQFRALLLSPEEERSVRHPLGAGGSQSLTSLPFLLDVAERGRPGHHGKGLLRDEEFWRQEQKRIVVTTLFFIFLTPFTLLHDTSLSIEIAVIFPFHIICSRHMQVITDKPIAFYLFSWHKRVTARKTNSIPPVFMACACHRTQTNSIPLVLMEYAGHHRQPIVFSHSVMKRPYFHL